MKDSTKIISHRFYSIAAVLFLFAGLVVIKLLDIQFVDGPYYREIAEQRVFKNFVISANRGNLYDSQMNLLATSVPKYTIRFDALTVSPDLFQEKLPGLAQALSTEFGKSTAHYTRLLRSARAEKNRYLLIGRNLGYAQYRRVVDFPLFRLGANKGGLIIEQRTVREHPIGKIAERTIGYERKDENGYYTRVGLEGAFGPSLRGKPGRRLKQKIAKGQWKPVSDDNEIEPRDGFDVIATLDVNIQDIVHHELLRQLEAYQADHGTAVVMETKTGAIKAISNLGRTAQGKYYEKLNYAVGEAHEPGSTFKLMAMVAALEDKVIDSSTVVDTDKGHVKFFDRTVYDAHHGGYGLISASKAFSLSSNTAFAKLIHSRYKQHPHKFVDRLFNMGLHQKIGLPIKGEGMPKIPYPGDKNWYGTTLPWMAFGYGLSMTPLQTLTYYNAIANDGVLVKPKFVKEIRALDQVEKRFATEVGNPGICSKETAKIVQEMMKNVVRHGTANNIYNPEFSMAGKTGTCQSEYWIQPGQYIASFAGYFPAEAPKYSCIVVIHKPQKELGYYGNIVAAPVFKRIAERIYSATPKVATHTADVELTHQQLQAYAKYERMRDKYKTILPNVQGMPAMDATPLLENMGLRVEIRGQGSVVKQSLNPGTKIVKGRTIYLEMS